MRDVDLVWRSPVKKRRSSEAVVVRNNPSPCRSVHISAYHWSPNISQAKIVRTTPLAHIISADIGGIRPRKWDVLLRALNKIIKVRVVKCLFGRDAQAWLKLDHLEEQIYCSFIHINTKFLKVFIGTLNDPLGEGRFEFGQLSNALPCIVSRSAHNLENLEDLSNL
jgi:hypothetical protein